MSSTSSILASEMWKQSDYIGRWNLRYFELHPNGVIRYYQDKHSKVLRGIMLITSVHSSAVRVDPFNTKVFCVTCRGKKWKRNSTPPSNMTRLERKYRLVLRAQSDATASRWIIAIRFTICPVSKRKFFTEAALPKLDSEESILQEARIMKAFPQLVQNRSVGLETFSDVFVICDAISFLVLYRSMSTHQAKNVLRRMLNMNIIIASGKAGSKSVSICDEFCLFRFCKAHISTDELDDAPATKDKVKSKNLFASKESLARNMTRVVRAAARAARKGDGVYSTEVGNSSSSDIVAAATRSLEHQAACTSEDLANTSNEDVSLAQRKAIRDLLLTASPSNESTSHFSVSAMFGSSVAQSSTYSSVALHRRLDMYISELREFRKRIAARSRKSVESVKKIKRQWKFQQSQLRAWAREKFIPTFKKARELEIALCESEQEKIRTVSEAISDRIGMAVNLRRIYSVLSGPERSVFATQIDDSFFGAPSNIASEVASSKSSKAIAAELRKVNNILERDVKKYLAVLSRSEQRDAICDAIVAQSRLINSGRLVVCESSRSSFASAVADVRTNLGRLIARFRQRVRQASSRAKLPPPAIFKTFCIFLSQKLAERFDLSAIVGDVNDEVEKEGGTRKEGPAQALDILVEDLIMQSVEVSELCELYVGQHDFDSCDAYWRKQQAWLLCVPPSAFDISDEFLPPREAVHEFVTPIVKAVDRPRSRCDKSRESGVCVDDVDGDDAVASSTAPSKHSLVPIEGRNSRPARASPPRTPSNCAYSHFTSSVSYSYMGNSLRLVREWAADSASAKNPTLMRMKLLRAMRAIHQDASEAAALNTGRAAILTGETLIPILVYVLIHSGVSHLHRSQFFMQKVALQSWHSTSEVAYYMVAINAALAFVCHLRRVRAAKDSKNSHFVVDVNPHEKKFHRIFDDSNGESDKAQCLRDLEAFISSQDHVEELLLSLGIV